VRVAWSNYIGRVQLYITNQYIPGSSAAGLLPGPNFAGSCQWVCRNFTVCGAFPGDPCYTPYGPNGVPVVYTIAVVGSTGLAHVTSEYQITASNVGDPTQLVAGAPTTDIVLAPYGTPGSSQTFTFNVGFAAAFNDIMVSASVNHGNVLMLIAPAFPTTLAPTPAPPSCTGNALSSCTGWLWATQTGFGDMVVYLNGAGGGGSAYLHDPSPCSPVTPAGTPAPAVSPNCAGTFTPSPRDGKTYLIPGQYYVTLVNIAGGPAQPAIAELSLLFQDFARNIPRTMLVDGQPLLLQSGPLKVCPGGSRDVNDVCDTSQSWNTTQGNVAWFRIPSNQMVTFVNVVVERLCGGNVTGECGTDLYIGISGCPYDGVSCSNNALVPYGASANFSYQMRDAVGGFYVPFEWCIPPGYVPPPGGVANPDCIYAVGVWATAPGQAPGVNTPPITSRVTLATPMGAERIPQDCPGGGRFCVLPMQAVVPGQYRTYEAYATSVAATTTVNVAASLCYGTGISVYTCTATGSCTLPSNPSAGNADITSTATTSSPVAQFSFTSTQDLYFMGITGTAPNPPPWPASPGVPVYELATMHGTGLVLGATGQISVAWNLAGTALNVQWPLPTLTMSNGAAFPLANALFFVHLFPVAGLHDPNWIISTPCGAELAVQNVQGATYNSVSQATACTSTGCSFLLTVPDPTAHYYIGVTASCSARVDPTNPTGTSACMPGNQEGQRVAWLAVPDSPFVPSPQKSPSPRPSPSPPAPAPAQAPKSSAGAVVATLVVLAAVGAFGWFGVERFYPGGRAAFYAPVMNLLCVEAPPPPYTHPTPFLQALSLTRHPSLLSHFAGPAGWAAAAAAAAAAASTAKPTAAAAATARRARVPPLRTPFLRAAGGGVSRPAAGRR
jgi:hypothetical protein